jgi:hypothetical protein
MRRNRLHALRERMAHRKNSARPQLVAGLVILDTQTLMLPVKLLVFSGH